MSEARTRTTSSGGCWRAGGPGRDALAASKGCYDAASCRQRAFGDSRWDWVSSRQARQEASRQASRQAGRQAGRQASRRTGYGEKEGCVCDVWRGTRRQAGDG